MISGTISHYRILQKLGAGGMGEVYLAHDTKLGRKVAIKFLLAKSLADESARKRLLREARAAAALDHPNICAIYEVSEEAGRSFIVMQHVEGETLAAKIKYKLLELKEALAIAVQVAEALSEAHSRGIVHRDIKPQNIMLTSRGQAKVLDFGLAKVMREPALAESAVETKSLLTEAGAIPGTIPYMSPEQVRGEEVDGRSDIFSFGCVLYELTCGRQPFVAKSAAETISAILTQDPPPLWREHALVPARLEKVVRRCLEKKREQRHQTMRELVPELEQASRECASAEELVSSGGVAKANGEEEVVNRRIERRRLRNSRATWIALTSVAALMVAGLVYMALWRNRLTTSQPAIRSLAVLPLKTLGKDASDDYLGLGIADAIITKTSQIGDLTVRPTSAVRKYVHQELDSLEAGRQLQADAVLDGSVQRAGEGQFAQGQRWRFIVGGELRSEPERHLRHSRQRVEGDRGPVEAQTK